MATYPGALPNFAESSPDQQSDPDSTGRTHSERHNDVEAELEAALAELGINPSGTHGTVAERLAAAEDNYGQHEVIWSGTAWRYKGATVTARPTIPDWPDAYVLWNTTADEDITTPPSLAVDGDQWLPHYTVEP